MDHRMEDRSSTNSYQRAVAILPSLQPKLTKARKTLEGLIRQRDDAIVTLWRLGMEPEEIAFHSGVSRSRIAQIVTARTGR